MTSDLFAGVDRLQPWRQVLCDGAVVLRQFAARDGRAIVEALEGVVASAPYRHMVTPGGSRMSATMSNCGTHGWIADRQGYRYVRADPITGRPWPALPEVLLVLAREAAASAGFSGFEPDACLINRYRPGARLSLHQDRDERDFGAPIVSVSLGIPATFLFGGERRRGTPMRVPVDHGDVVVWGGPARLRFHGIAPLGRACHPLLGEQRINLTLRKAG